VNETLFKLSEEEHQKILSTKGYRSSIEILKEFTKSNLRVNFGNEKPGILPAQISYFITDVIAKQFKGERKLAEEKARHILKEKLQLSYSKLKGSEKIGFDKLSLYVAFCLDLDKINEKDKAQLVKLIKEKGTNEFDYILSYNKFPFRRYYTAELLEFESL
jgi:hypothetical protein